MLCLYSAAPFSCYLLLFWFVLFFLGGGGGVKKIVMPSLPMASVALKIAIVIEAYLGPNKRLKYFNPLNANPSKMVKHTQIIRW